MIKGASLFSSSGIGEFYFKKKGIDIKVANELLPRRAQLYSYFYPATKMICGDITNEEIFRKVNEEIKKNKCKFLIATPPCQGMSTLGKKEYTTDKRNFLFMYAIDIIKDNDFDYILFENVFKFIEIKFPYFGETLKLPEILNKEFGDKYIIESFVLNAMDYGVPQSRPRSFIKMYKKRLKWDNPLPQSKITLKDCIGHLPSLESGEDSGIKWHYAKKHNDREVLAVKHTNEGKSAIYNEIYYPKKPNGEKIKGFHNTYKRMKWDEPAPTRAINNGNMGGTNNIHPGRQLPDGTISDARVLTLRELFIVSSLPPELDLPEWCTDNLIRTVIGEAIPPLFSYNIIKGIREVKND
jgi:DNA (cytosine-5)-methyltransferase 1